MLNRVAPTASPTMALTRTETSVLDLLSQGRTFSKHRTATLSSYLTQIARLGGYLARTKDPPFGNAVLWRGVSRLSEIKLGFVMAAQLVGN
jgi:hypothetical protein